MPNKSVEMLMEAVAKLQTDMEWVKKGMVSKADVRWLKLGMVGTISSLVAVFSAILVALITIRH